MKSNVSDHFNINAFYFMDKMPYLECLDQNGYIYCKEIKANFIRLMPFA